MRNDWHDHSAGMHCHRDAERKLLRTRTCEGMARRLHATKSCGAKGAEIASLLLCIFPPRQVYNDRVKPLAPSPIRVLASHQPLRAYIISYVDAFRSNRGSIRPTSCPSYSSTCFSTGASIRRLIALPHKRASAKFGDRAVFPSLRVLRGDRSPYISNQSPFS